MRISFIDKLKGTAILFVVMGHVAEYSFGIKETIFNQFYASFHMPLFMFLSGLFAYKSFEHWNISESISFIKKKFLRVMLPFLTIGGLYMLLFTTDLVNGYTKTCAVYWFFPALFYCMIAGLIIGIILHRIGGGIIADLTLAVFIITLNQFLRKDIFGLRIMQDIPYFENYVAMYPFFYFGVLCARHKTIGNLAFRSTWVYTISLVLYVIAMICLEGERKFTGVFAIVILSQLFMKHDKYIPSFIAKTGTYSLEIYAFHWFLLPQFPSLQSIVKLPQIAGAANENFILLFILTLCFAIPIALTCVGITKCIRTSRHVNAFFFGFMPKTTSIQ